MTELRTRKPTGKPSWPILLLAGAEKTGKTYSAALASSSDLVGRTWWVTIGEDQPDEYGQLGDFDIVEHDGSYLQILETLRTIALQPLPQHGVPLLVIDSMTRLWDILKDNAQATANRKKSKRPGEDATITTDLWNVAAAQWGHVMDAVRAFPGPVILTARLDVVAVMNDAGQPTTQKTTKVQAHKSLVYDVGAIIEMPTRGETWITGLRSLTLKLEERTRAAKDFTVDGFWRQLGLVDTVTGYREHSGTRVDGERAVGPVYDPGVAERWLPQIAGATYLGPKKTPEGDGLRAVMVRAGRADVLEHLLFEPAEGEPVKTIGQYITERADGMPEEPPAAPAEDDVPMWATAAPIAEDELV